MVVKKTATKKSGTAKKQVNKKRAAAAGTTAEQLPAATVKPGSQKESCC